MNKEKEYHRCFTCLKFHVIKSDFLKKVLASLNLYSTCRKCMRERAKYKQNDCADECQVILSMRGSERAQKNENNKEDDDLPMEDISDTTPYLSIIKKRKKKEKERTLNTEIEIVAPNWNIHCRTLIFSP